MSAAGKFLFLFAIVADTSFGTAFSVALAAFGTFVGTLETVFVGPGTHSRTLPGIQTETLGLSVLETLADTSSGIQNLFPAFDTFVDTDDTFAVVGHGSGSQP